MAAQNTIKTAVVVNADQTMTFTFSEKDQVRFGKAQGLRHTIGAAYLAGNKDARQTLVEYWGRGAVRRGLLVLAKGRNTSEEDAAKATTLAGELRTREMVAA